MNTKLLLLGTILTTSLGSTLLGQTDEGKSSEKKGEGKGKAAARRQLGEGRPMEGRPGMMPGGGMAMMQMLPVMKALDTDQDGTISATEIENASKALLALDKNGDGALSGEELRPDMSQMAGRPMPGGPGAGGPPGGMPTPEMMARMFENRDADADGKLTGDEIPERMRERVAMVDTNGDGSIDRDEMKKAAARMTGGPGGQQRGRENNKAGEGVKPKRPTGDGEGSSDGQKKDQSEDK